MRVERNAAVSGTDWKLTVVRLAWLLMATLSLVLLVPEVQATLAASEHPCTSNLLNCPNGQITASTAHALEDIGISRAMYAYYFVALLLLVQAVAYAIAVLLLARRSLDLMVVVTAFACLFINFSSFATPGGTVGEVSHAVSSINTILGALFFFLFPSGRFVPRWSVLLLVGYLASEFSPGNSGWGFLVFLVFLVSIIVVQIYRYRWVSTPQQQQQTKLVVLGIGFFISALLAAVLISLADPGLENQSIPFLLVQTLVGLLQLPVLIGAGIAILRYRLWDVDLLISRSLMYIALTISLGAVYIGSVIGLQALSRTITGRQSDVAVAVSTLLIAALFNPFRRRIQRVITRTFYRRAYDAGRVLATFGERCRDETDLERLRLNLAQVVEDAIQPSGLSLWLRDPVPSGVGGGGERVLSLPTAVPYS